MPQITLDSLQQGTSGSCQHCAYDYLIVGAGFAGSVIAERLAQGMGQHVLLLDRREHIGGNAYDHYDDAGVLIHRYGPHIFHTNAQRIVDYLSRFTEWRPYEHRVLASVDGCLVPIPINLTTRSCLPTYWVSWE
jgi:UDP-galactopyranose mutase